MSPASHEIPVIRCAHCAWARGGLSAGPAAGDVGSHLRRHLVAHLVERHGRDLGQADAEATTQLGVPELAQQLA